MAICWLKALSRSDPMKSIKLPLAFALSLLLIIAGNTSSTGDEVDIPFRPGEQLKFVVYWAFIPAGEATLEILPYETREGESCFHFRATAKTFEYIDAFYKVRDTIDAFADKTMNRSMVFMKLKQGKSKRNVVVNFDWKKEEARYSDSGDQKVSVPIRPGTFDPLSIFYAFRVHELEEGKELVQPVTDGKRIVISTAKVIRREKINAGGKEYDTFLVEPEMKNIGGIFEKSDKSSFQIWVTADHYRVPVRIKSGVAVGSFVAELTSWEKGEPK
ncbi:MAG: DUF3108 domain-containing protein [Deltaproteobacteria bacterium HGW-Deltaproteobacteria-21]|nr:MAG: DUF3108 domain-containing protein [Deltaproteobacteria bacterium HGW-Deltaproteobacteria-21]